MPDKFCHSTVLHAVMHTRLVDVSILLWAEGYAGLQVSSRTVVVWIPSRRWIRWSVGWSRSWCISGWSSWGCSCRSRNIVEQSCDCHLESRVIVQSHFVHNKVVPRVVVVVVRVSRSTNQGSGENIRIGVRAVGVTTAVGPIAGGSTMMAVGWWVDSVSNHKAAASAAQDVMHLLPSEGHVFVGVHSQARSTDTDSSNIACVPQTAPFVDEDLSLGGVLGPINLSITPGLNLVAVLRLSSQLTHHRDKGRRLVVPVNPGAVVVEVGCELVIDRLCSFQVCRVSSGLCHPGLGKTHLIVIVGASIDWRGDRICVLPRMVEGKLE